MRVVSLRVRSFGCVEEAELELAPGLNVLYGPNDLGKSTLAHALRAALLLPSGHREAQGFAPWHRDAVPEVRLTFAAPDEPGSTVAPRTWRVHKQFSGRKGQANLEWSNDGQEFTLEQKGPGVDTKLRQLLGWGVLEPRARGPRGFPTSFLTTVLLGPQAVPGSMLGRSLEDDPTESGRERLTEALQALAQDPRFKEILDAAQDKVDEAFTPTGKARTGRRSPMSGVRQTIETLENRLREEQDRVHDSDTVRLRLLELDGSRAEVIVARDEAEEALQRTQAAYEQGQRRVRVQARVQEAHEALERGRAVLAERRRWQEAAQRHLDGRPAAQAALDRAVEAQAQATSDLARAEAALRALEEGGDAQARLARQSLETRRLELKTEHERVHGQLRSLEDAIELAGRIDRLEEECDALAQDLAAAERAATEAEAARREADTERRLYDAALRFGRWKEAKARVDAAEEAGREAATLLEAAAQEDAAIEQAEAAQVAVGLPDAATLEAWRTLAEERRVAEARLGVGLSLVVRRSDGVVEVGRDEQPLAAVEVDVAIEAERRLRVRLGQDTELEVEGGGPQARAAREAVEARWADEVAPQLERLGVQELAEVQKKIAEARELRQQLAGRRHEVQRQRDRAAALQQRADELTSLRQALDASAQALAGHDKDALEKRVGGHDEATLRKRQVSAEARVDEAQHRHAQAKSRAAGLGSQRQSRQEELERARAQLEAMQLPEDPEDERDAVFDKLAAIEGEQEAVEQDLAEHDQARAQQRVLVQTAMTEAQAEADRARLATEQARRELEERREKLAQAEGRLAQLEEQAAQLDERQLEAAHKEATEELEGVPVPEPVVDAADLEDAVALRDVRQQGVRELEAAFEQQRGALKQVGGSIARERAHETQQALEGAKQRERDLELDYEAWRLLAETLREAETAEGRHLGEALGDPVHERFAALTGGRYGPLSLGRDLKAQGLEVAGDLRDIGALSEGVQDQLATILRIAIAEHLGTALVLDDHLAQTDPGRVAWFRELLLKVSDRAQIIVLTCRPEDYLHQGEHPGEGESHRDSDRLRAVDLTRVIRRAGA